MCKICDKVKDGRKISIDKLMDVLSDRQWNFSTQELEHAERLLTFKQIPDEEFIKDAHSFDLLL